MRPLGILNDFPREPRPLPHSLTAEVDFAPLPSDGSQLPSSRLRQKLSLDLEQQAWSPGPSWAHTLPRFAPLLSVSGLGGGPGHQQNSDISAPGSPQPPSLPCEPEVAAYCEKMPPSNRQEVSALPVCRDGKCISTGIQG